MIPALVVIPLVAGLLAFALREDILRRALLLLTALAHAGLTVYAWVERPPPVFGGWLALDSTGLLFLSIASLLFLASACYCMAYLRRERVSRHRDIREGLFFGNEPEAVFVGCLLMFLASMTLVTMSQHFGLLWVSVEATTLASAPLIFFHRHQRSLEATWKYLLICSVGIALALVGNLLLAVASASGDHERIPPILGQLLRHGSLLHADWLKAAFIFFLVGYGTKMGLAPLHTWLPDAYSEAPSAFGVLSSALLTCSFLAILRGYQVCTAAGHETAAFCQELLVFFGLLSMAVAAVFMVSQTDFKRMLGYSSIEHMGILALGMGLGGDGNFGSVLHAVNHSLVKAALFFVAGNIVASYESKSIKDVQGMAQALPLSGVLWIVGFLAIVGLPPFGTFLSEFTILKAALDHGHGVVAGIYLALLAIVFIGMASHVLRMYQGQPNNPAEAAYSAENIWSTAPPVVLSLLVLSIGLYVPPMLNSVLRDVAETLGGPPW